MTATNRIAFLHIPKTAGCSVNDAFVRSLGPERCTTFKQAITDDDFLDRTFVSGHGYLGDITAHAFRFTFVREPLAQIASHLMWIDHYNLPSFEAEATSFCPSIRDAIGALKSVDFSSAKSIAGFLNRHPRDSELRIANLQSELLSFRRGFVEPLDDASLAERAIAGCSTLNFVGLTEYLRSDLDRVFQVLGLAANSQVGRLNVSPATRTVDLTVPSIRAALETYVGADLRLWDAIQARREARPFAVS